MRFASGTISSINSRRLIASQDQDSDTITLPPGSRITVYKIGIFNICHSKTTGISVPLVASLNAKAASVG